MRPARTKYIHTPCGDQRLDNLSKRGVIEILDQQIREYMECGLTRVEAEVDESMMRQVFYNLASNAFKAMPDGGTLTISLQGRKG